MPKFHGIRIEATGQSIATVGDGNQMHAHRNHGGAGDEQIAAADFGFRKVSG
jgi:hypothetical protein